jgi:nicotinamidase-related amidase
MPQALVLIDLQNDYFPGGRMELVGADAAVAQAAVLLAAFRQAALPVIHIQHIAKRAGATFFLPDTDGAQIHAAVAPVSGEEVIIKHFPSSFRETTLKAKLDALGITDITFAGAMTQLCVDTTVRAACDMGFKCALAHDACATRDLKFGDRTVAAVDVQAAYMAALNGSFATVGTAAELAARLQAA